MGGAAEGGERYHAARAVETECMRRAAGIVTLSETMRADILGRGGISPDVVTVVPNAVDIAGFTPGPRDEALAHTLGIDPDETVIGYISSFTSYEGIVYLIEAAALLRERGRRIKLLLVGDGEDRANLEAAAERTGLTASGGVVFTGRVPHREIARYYRTIDVFVVPRTNDRVSQLVTPLKPYEAMAMEKALVVSAVGALLEIVDEGITARTFTPEDCDQPGRRHRAAPRRPGRTGSPRGGRPRMGRRRTGRGSRTDAGTSRCTSGSASREPVRPIPRPGSAIGCYPTAAHDRSDHRRHRVPTSAPPASAGPSPSCARACPSCSAGAA